MKDELRELAERWKGPECRNGSSHECADELLAILDAEGDGGAVAWREKVDEIANNIGESLNAGCDQDAVDRINVYVDELFALSKRTHPARSGGVSEAELGALAVVYGRGYRHGHESTVEGGYVDVVHYDHATYWLDTVREMVEEDDDLRAALEHFAKGERHER